jgi:hypothetical protein
VYQVESDDNAGYQVAKLPEDALAAYASLIDLIALHPWSGEPLRSTDSKSPMRVHTFGHNDVGLAIYLILEDQQRVVVLRVLWAG